MITGSLCTLIALTAMRRREKHNVGKAGWLCLILLTPPIGLILFLIFGGKKVSAEHDQRDVVALPRSGQRVDHKKTDRGQIAVKRGLPPPSENNQLEIHSTADAMYEALMDTIDSAKECLLLHSFILIDDSVGNEIVRRLCEKAADGVQVRLMVDGFGSFKFPDSLLKRIDRAGGKAVRFKPLLGLSRFAYSNYRNHRKVLVADGKRAVIGGANFVQYEVTDKPDDQTWIDCLFSVTGDAARQAEAIFLSDWKFATDEEIAASTEDLEGIADLDDNQASLQVIPVGADGPTEILDDVWLTAINRATERIWICTPYFVPPPMAMRSLAMAIRRGLDVRILYPDSSDMIPADYARHDHLQDLHQLGAKLLRIPNKMMHMKLLLIDSHVAYIGSANFDMRSFFLNYELVLGVFNDKKVNEFARWFQDLSGQCIDGPKPDTATKKTLGLLTRVLGEEL